MKKTILKKTAGMLALLMVVSMLVPVLAFAFVDFKDVEFTHDGKVTGVVYGDAQIGTANSVFLNVYKVGGGLLAANVEASVTTDTYHYAFTYDLSSVIDATYKQIELQFKNPTTNEIVSRIVDRNAAPALPGFVFVPPTSADNELVSHDGHIDAAKLKALLDKHLHVIIRIHGDSAHIPASALVGAREGATITIINDNGSYTLPLSVLDLEALAKELGIDIDDMIITVTIKKVDDATATQINSAAQAIGADVLTGGIDFSLTAEGNGKSVAINSFGNTYVSRTINVTGSVYGDKATGVLYNPTTGEFSFVPSTFASEDGNTVVTLKRNTNSIYTAIALDKSFADVPANHWAEEDITLLANKLVVFGDSATTFAMNRNITRAEFAALVVRSLGLSTAATTTQFTDVEASKWYAAEVATAVEAGIVFGYGDNTFRPNAVITREELAAMVVRAQKYAGQEITSANVATVLAKFTDAGSVSNWARAEMAAAIEAEIVFGMSETTISAKSNATRAQAAAMVKRFLSNAEFIN